MFYKAKWR